MQKILGSVIPSDDEIGQNEFEALGKIIQHLREN
jgi:hypothetical protein